MSHFEEWFRSSVPDSVHSAGGARSSVEAWYTILPKMITVTGLLFSNLKTEIFVI